MKDKTFYLKITVAFMFLAVIVLTTILVSMYQLHKAKGVIYEAALESRRVETAWVLRRADSIQKVADSLKWELFPAQIELGRYKVAYDSFARSNPKGAAEYQTIVSTTTE